MAVAVAVVVTPSGVAFAAAAPGVPEPAASAPKPPPSTYTPLSADEKAALKAKALATPVPDLSKTEIVADRTQRSRTFLDPVKGLHVTELSSAALNYRDAKGGWSPIDNKLVSDGAGGWKNGANSYAVSLPGNLTKPVTVTDATDPGAWMSVELAPAKTPVAALPPIPGQDALPVVPVVAGAVGKVSGPGKNQVDYPAPLKGVDVSYAATGLGAKETTTLASLAAVDALPAGSLSYTLRVASGLSLAKAKDGALTAKDTAGKPVFVVPAAFMDDADGAHSADVMTTLNPDRELTTAASNAWTLTLTPSRGWLAAPERVWPVVVDPTIGGPSAMKGCTIRSDTPTVNDCAGTEILTSVNGANERRALLDFDTLLDVVPANAQMAAAYLNLYVPSATGSPSSNVDIRAIKSAGPWTTAATWNKYDATNSWAAPGGDRTPTIYERTPFAASGTYQQAQVTRLVQDWAEGNVSDFGFILQKTGTDTTAITRFGSPSAANPPTLYVEWDPRTGVRKGNTAIINEPLSDRTSVSVNPATGNASVTTKELTIAGMGIDLNVAHTSQSLDTGGLGPQGYGWTSSLHGQRLTPYNGGTGANAETLFYTDGSGAQWTFVRNKNTPTPDWIRPKGLDLDLQGYSNGTTNGYTLTDRKTKTVITTKNIGTSTNEIFGVDSIADRNGVNGNKISFTYDASVRSSFDGTLMLRKVTDTRGRDLTVTNPGTSFDSYITDSASRNVIYIGSASQLDDVTDAGGGHVKYEYDSGHRVTAVITPSGQRTEMTYDSTGRILTLKRISAALGNPSWGFAYTAYTRNASKPSTKTTVTDPLSHTTEYTADGRGRVTGVKNALGKDEAKTYSPNDDIAQATGRTGAGTSGAQTSENFYDAADTFRLSSTKAPTGATTTYDYTGQTGTNLYNPASSVDEQGNSSTYAYNPDGNELKTTRGGIATYTLRQGDTDIPAYGNAVINCGPSGGATKKGAVCETRDGAYTASGANRFATTAHRTVYEYNAKGELVTLRPPGGGSLNVQTFTYDGLSRMATMTDGNGKTTTYGYDAMDRRTYVQHDDTTVESHYFGDTGGATDGWQQSLDEYGPGGAPLTRHTVYGRDDLGRLNSLQRPEGTVTMGYDKASNLARYTDNSGDTYYAYNNADQLTSLQMPGGNCTGLTYASPGATTSGCILFSLDDDGRRTGTKYPGGNLTQATTLDNSGRIKQIVGKTGTTEQLNLSYQYETTPGATPSTDKALVQKVIDNPAGGTSKTTTYSYDGRNQLIVNSTKLTSGGTQSGYERFCYDPAGNRTKYYRVTAVTDCSTTAAATSTYNTANQLTAITGVTPTGAAIAGTSISYNGAGDETAGKSAIGRTTTYGDRGQATSFTPAGGSAISQAYSGTGNGDRVTSGTTTLVPSPLGPAPAWSKTGTTSTWTVRDPDGQLLAIRVGPTTTPSSATAYFPFTDNLGNIRAMTTAGGTTPSVAYTYSAFGTILSTTGSLDQPYRYGSGYTDTATGLAKLGIRYYDPALGRFTQQDPTGKDDFQYAYSNNCASTYNDPTGGNPFIDFIDTLSACAAGATLATSGVAGLVPLVTAFTGLGGAAVLAIAATYGCFGGVALEGAVGDTEIGQIVTP